MQKSIKLDDKWEIRVQLCDGEPFITVGYTGAFEQYAVNSVVAKLTEEGGIEFCNWHPNSHDHEQD